MRFFITRSNGGAKCASTTRKREASAWHEAGYALYAEEEEEDDDDDEELFIRSGGVLQAREEGVSHMRAVRPNLRRACSECASSLGHAREEVMMARRRPPPLSRFAEATLQF